MDQPELHFDDIEDNGMPEDTEAGSNPHDGPLRRMVDDNFLQYASYVIKDRAIPDMADGLKPVQRRILYALHKNDDGKFIKVANIVGYTMQFHPHGDASIGDALVSLTNRRYLIEGQGNFGNIFTGDPAAASRYIECRLTDLARDEIFNDELTRFVPSYDGRNKEPVVLPAKLPLLLMLGAEGIAVGLSTKILPHNFTELLKAQIAILEKKKFKILPDFQQGCLMDAREYDKGNGKIRLRAVIEKKDKQTLIIREIPFGTTTDSLIASIEEAAKKQKLKVKSINDYTAEHIEIEVQLPSGQDLDKTIQALYAFTHCERSISARAIVINDNRPEETDVREILKNNTKQLVIILTRELRAERKRLENELHNKTLVQLFVEKRIYKTIEECKTYPKVQQAVLDGLEPYRDHLRRDVTKQDVEMLLGIKIKRISRYDMDKNRKDIDGILKDLDVVEKNLKQVTAYSIRYLKALLRKYGEDYPRRTKVEQFKEVEVRKLTAKELSFCYDREKGYIGYDVEGDPMFECSSLDKVLFLWDDGSYKVMQPPDKFFADKNLIYAAPYRRGKIMTMVYNDGEITYMKRFKFGGVIMNRDYLCTPEDSKVLLFTDAKPKEIYVKYKRAKRQRINQQVFHTDKLRVSSVKAKGSQMTVKTVRWISTEKPRNWNRGKDNPRGALID
jgi:topoisomerase-4 subunit A